MPLTLLKMYKKIRGLYRRVVKKHEMKKQNFLSFYIILFFFFFRDSDLQDHFVQQICFHISLSNANPFPSIPGPNFSMSSLTLPFHRSLGLPSGHFPCGTISCTIFTNDPVFRLE